jgi:hypothetical protein
MSLSPMTVPEESDGASLVVGGFPLALRALALGFRFSSDEDKSEPLESSLLDDELTSSDSGSFVTGSFCGSESSELEEE